MTETVAAQALIADTSEQFKLAFGHQPAGVAIITATDENRLLPDLRVRRPRHHRLLLEGK